MSLQDILWEKAQEQLYISKEEYLTSLEGWDIVPHYVDKELAWVTLQKGPLFHFHSVGQTRALPARRLRAFLQSIIDAHGYAETRTPKDDERQHRFNRIYGFKVVGEDEFDTHFRIERLPHA